MVARRRQLLSAGALLLLLLLLLLLRRRRRRRREKLGGRGLKHLLETDKEELVGALFLRPNALPPNGERMQEVRLR